MVDLICRTIRCNARNFAIHSIFKGPNARAIYIATHRWEYTNGAMKTAVPHRKRTDSRYALCKVEFRVEGRKTGSGPELLISGA